MNGCEHLVQCDAHRRRGTPESCPAVGSSPDLQHPATAGVDRVLSMSIAALQWAFNLILEDHTEKVVLLALADHYNDQSECCWPSVARLERFTGAKNRTIQRALTRLVKAGHVVRQDRPGKSTVFELVIHPRQIDTPTPSTRRGTPAKMTPHPRQIDGLTLIEPQTNPKLNHNHERGASRDVNDARATLKTVLRDLAKQSTRRMQ